MSNKPPGLKTSPASEFTISGATAQRCVARLKCGTSATATQTGVALQSKRRMYTVGTFNYPPISTMVERLLGRDRPSVYQRAVAQQTQKSFEIWARAPASMQKRK